MEYDKSWFTITKIDEDTYAISENKHWEETNCYLLIGVKKNLLIDTGLGVGNIKDVVSTISDCPVQVATTHVHWDHIGGHKYFMDIAVHEHEKEWLSGKFPIPLNIVKSNLMRESCIFPNDFHIEEYKIFQGNPTVILEDENIIDLGNRQIRVIHTPGHSPGHICFYEEHRGYLYSGDLIYQGTLDAFYPSTNPIEFMQSIHRIRNLNIEKILPGHHAIEIPASLVEDIDNGFSVLYSNGKLQQGNGLFQFNNFSIHI